jgi:hypothetical protein
MTCFTRPYLAAALVGVALLGAACSDSQNSPIGPGAATPGPITTSSDSTKGWYAAPSGSAAGDGTISRPWDLPTALAGGSGKVQPGETIWLRGGTYSGTFVSSLSGSASAPITLRQYPHERATIDGGSTGAETFTINGQWANYWGFEIMQSGTQRFGTAGSGSGLRGTGVYVNNASNIKLVNLVVHDVGHGVYTENTSHNVEIYGLVIYDGGYEDGIRSDGHGIYLHNDGVTPKVVRNNVIFNQFGFGIHGYAEATSQEKGLVLDGNVVFNNGTVSSFRNNPNLQLGGNGVADNDIVTNNLLYFSPGVVADLNAKVGYHALLNGTTLFANNTLVGGAQALDVGYWQNLTVRGNTFSGPNMMVVQHDANAPATEHWSGNAYLHDAGTTAWQLGTPATLAVWSAAVGAADQSVATPSTPAVTVLPNAYEAGRATIVVYNWGGQGAVGVDLSGVLKSGTHYEIRNVQDIFGAPVASGTYGGGGVSVPMNGVTPAQPIGGSPHAPQRTGPDFDVFVVVTA